MSAGATTRKDDNDYPTIFGLSSSDGITPIRVQFNPATGGMVIDEVTVIAFTPAMKTATDGNDQPVAKGVSTSDGVTVLPWYVNPATGGVLVDRI